MGNHTATKTRNRELILDAARSVFQSQGCSHTTVRDIIRATPLASGTFYNYFKSVEEVFDALARESEDALTGAVVAESPATPEAFWRALVRAAFDQAARLPLQHLRLYKAIEYANQHRLFCVGDRHVLCKFVIGLLLALEGRDNAVPAAAMILMRAFPALP